MKIFEFSVSNAFETTLIEILSRFEFFESNVFETTIERHKHNDCMDCVCFLSTDSTEAVLCAMPRR